jgi:hypothetical protein
VGNGTSVPLVRPVKTLDMGFGDLVEVAYLERVFKISRRTAMKYLRALRIMPLYMGKDVFFSLPTFKRILYVLSMPGSTGFVFPGSRKKNDPRIVRNPAYMVEVSDEILRKAEDPSILAEMSGVSGRDVGLLRKFVPRAKGKESGDGTAATNKT